MHTSICERCLDQMEKKIKSVDGYHIRDNRTTRSVHASHNARLIIVLQIHSSAWPNNSNNNQKCSAPL